MTGLLGGRPKTDATWHVKKGQRNRDSCRMFKSEVPPERRSFLKASGWRWDFSSLEGQFGGEEEEEEEAFEVGEWLSKGPRGEARGLSRAQ